MVGPVRTHPLMTIGAERLTPGNMMPATQLANQLAIAICAADRLIGRRTQGQGQGPKSVYRSEGMSCVSL